MFLTKDLTKLLVKMKVTRMLFLTATIVIALFIIGSIWLYFAQTGMVFYPSTEFRMTPDMVGLEFDDVYIDVADDENIHAWYFPPESGRSDAPLVLFSHGNAGNISNRLETALALVEMGAGCLMYDYRGYGKSTGKPSEANAYQDNEAAYRWLLANKTDSPDNIVIFGRSLGGAIAVELASRFPARGLIVESSFTSIAEMGKKMFPFMPIKLLLHLKLNSLDRIGDVNMPVLITHSPDDQMVPYHMGQALFEAAVEPKRFFDLYGPHNSVAYMAEPEYQAAVASILFAED